MQLTEKKWDSRLLDEYSNEPTAYTVSKLEQPSIGIQIGWNEPTKPWKPYIALDLWRWNFQIGWLLDMKEEADA